MPDKSKASVLLKKVGLGFTVAAFLLLLLEGLASFALLGHGTVERLRAHKTHTRYDEVLGWVNLPSLSIPDMYGPGKPLTTNTQGFRNEVDFAQPLPVDRIRVVCSGDSYTFGLGVGNRQAWPHLLAEIDSRLEVVNLGNIGYGIDQSFLHYRRVQEQLEHDIHLFAFITDDFRRMQYDEFLGYARPRLEVLAERLEVTNVPVPRSLAHFPALTIVRRELETLALSRLLRRAVGNQLTREVARNPDRLDRESRELALAILKELHEVIQRGGGVVVLVYLPSGNWDYDENPESPAATWQAILAAESAERSWLFIDLIEEMRKLPRTEVENLFADHYSAAGNEFVATVLYERLMLLPQIQQRFEARLRN